MTARDKFWQTALHIAAANRAMRCTEALLSHVSSVNMADRTGRSALHHAAHSGCHEVRPLLLPPIVSAPESESLDVARIASFTQLPSQHRFTERTWPRPKPHNAHGLVCPCVTLEDASNLVFLGFYTCSENETTTKKAQRDLCLGNIPYTTTKKKIHVRLSFHNRQRFSSHADFMSVYQRPLTHHSAGTFAR